MLCDFHSHSTVSDGSMSPTELVQEAKRCSVGVLALTDHDDVGGIEEARAEALKVGIELVPGIEISASDADGARRMHILGLDIDPENVPLLTRLKEIGGDRLRRARRIVEQLREVDVDIRFERVAEIAGHGSIGRPHVARALVEIGACSDDDDAFVKYLRRGRPGYVAHDGMSSAEAIGLIHGSGGIASLAHPPFSAGIDAPGGLEVFIERLVANGLDGLEVHHPGHRPGQIKKLRGFARQFDLVETGGSDFHGAAKPHIRLGRGRGKLRLRQDFYEAIRAKITQRRDNAGVLTPSGAASNLARPQ